MAKKVEKATIRDATQIHSLINHFANKGEMLPRPLSEIYENIRDYFVIRQSERVIACAALHVNWEDLAEIKSVAVSEDYQKFGLGDLMVDACLKEANELGIKTVFCLTYAPDFFTKCGFILAEKTELPHKVWGECYRCPKFPNCDESALIYKVRKKD
ncbi:MAG: N-acetyltransferase [Dehalococcoidia bacterium]|nr:MAG: N-acetyltransferase [Dehalococcoidia bacterium]